MGPACGDRLPGRSDPGGPGAGQRGPAPGWTERQTLLLRAADELHTSARIARPTWDGLTAHLTARQLIELPMLVGHYHLLAFTLNSLQVQPEPGLPPMP